MAVANTNLAYNLEAFATQEKPTPKSQKQRQQLKVVKTRRQAMANAFSPKVACAFAVVVTLVSLIVYNQVCINEVAGEINRLTEEIAILESENVRVAALMDSAVSVRAVTQQAENELGMKKLDQYQTVYVNLYPEDYIVPSVRPERTPAETFAAMIASAINGVKEYIAGS